MIKIKPGNQQQQSTNEKQKKNNKEKEQVDDVDDEYTDDLISVQKKEKKKASRISSQLVKDENTWEQQKDNFQPQQPTLAVPTTKPIKTLKNFNIQVTQTAQTKIGSDGVPLQVDEFPELGQAVVQTSKKQQQKAQALQLQQQQPQQQQQTQGGKGIFSNSLKRGEIVQATQPVQQSPQKPQEPAIQIARGPVSFVHTKKEESHLQNVQAPIQPVVVVQQTIQPEKWERAIHVAHVEPTPEIDAIKPKHYQFQNTNPHQKLEQTVPVPVEEIKKVHVEQAVEQEVVHQINFSAPKAFVNSKQKEQLQIPKVVEVTKVEAPKQELFRQEVVEVQTNDEDSGWEIVEVVQKKVSKPKKTKS